ncbi:MAG TPA: hypothetical protein VJ916_01150, partial [Anaerovoracaceae bacterium]|nr:hypothetical protein [Anaerovoracaceae bacterium]
QVKDYESKEEFKKDFLDESVVEANLTDLYVPVGKGSTMKMSERVAAAKNLREGKQTKQAKLLEEVLDNYYENGFIELVAPDKKTKVPVKTRDILRPQKELSDVEIYEEYARERAKENEPLPNEGVEKTMNARDELVSEMKLSVPMEGETTKNTEKRVRGDIQQRIGKINDMLKTAKEKKYITAVENQAIRNKLKNVAKGTEYELKQAIDYAEKVIGNAEFRAKEKQKLKDIKSIRKEVKAVKADRKKGRTKAYRTPEADAFAKEANALAQEKGVLENMSAEEVADILNIIRQTKGELREKAAKKYEEYKKRMSEFEAKGRAAITPIRRKGKKAKEEYVKHGKEGRPNWVQELSDAIHETSLWIWDANLTSFISRIDALSGEGKGKVGSEFLNKKFYQGILQAGETGYKKFLNTEGDALMEAVENIYNRKDGRDIFNDHTVETVEIPYQRREKDQFGNTKLVQEKREVSKGEAIKMYMLLQDQSLTERLFEPWTVEESGRIKGNGYTDATVEALESSLSKQDKQYAEYLFERYRKMRERYNEFMLDKYAVSLPANDFYSNIYSDYHGADIGTDMQAMISNDPQGTLQANNTIARVKNKERIKDIDATAAFRDYVDKMEWMYQMTDALQVYRAIFKSEKNKRAIKAYYGESATKLIDFYEKMIMRDVTNMNQREIDRFTKYFARAALGVNPNITVKQLFSISMALTEVNPLQFTREMASLPKEIKTALADKKGFLYDIVSSDAIRMRGDVGLGLDVFMNPKATKNKYSQYKILNAVDKTLKYARKGGAMNIMLGDKAAASLGGMVVGKTRYKQYLKNYDDVTARKMAMEDVSSFIDNTQQSMSMFNTSMRRVETGSLGRVMSAFTSAPAQLLRIEMNLWRNVLTGVRTGKMGQKQVLKNIGRIAIVRQLIPMLYQLAADGYEWDTKNQAAAAALGNLTGLFFIGKIAEKIKNEWQDVPFDVSLLPVLDNIQGLVATSFQLGHMSAFPERYNEREKQKLHKRARTYLGLFAGIPVRQIEMVAKGELPVFFKAYENDQQEVARQAIRENKQVLDILEDRYGRDFVYEEGEPSQVVKPYMNEYIFEKYKGHFDEHEATARKVMDTWDYDDKYTYLVNKGKKMDNTDFRQMMRLLNKQYTLGEYKLRIVSDGLREDVEQGVRDRR